MRVAAIGLLCGMAAFLITAAVAISLRVRLLGAILQRIAGLPGIRRRLRPNMTEVHRVEDLLLSSMSCTTVPRASRASCSSKPRVTDGTSWSCI